VIYRPYIPEDFDQLYALEECCFKPPFRFGRRYMRQLVGRSDVAVWIAAEGGLLMGFAIADWSEGRSGVTAYIQTIEVAPESRGRGIGGELLGRIESSARQAGARLLWLHVDAKNAGAIRLYEAQGYRCEGKQENYYPQDRAALIYAKRLDSSPISSAS
jgi:ribosomal protein S18 acetylase RimI-like enzyme